MTRTNGPILLADVGGTNLRLALLDSNGIGEIWTDPVANHADLAVAIRVFLDRRAAGLPRAALIAVAGPVVAGRCVLTNSRWIVDAAQLAAATGIAGIRLLNDLEAVAWSLPRLQPQDLHAVGGGEGHADAALAVLAPGTGLGMSCLVPTLRGLHVMASEGGHAGLPAGDAREAAVIELLRKQYGHVSAERALSGPGLVALYHAIARLDGVDVPQRTPQIIAQSAMDGSCVVSANALGMFCAMLGALAGDVALHFGAGGGVFIAGGIVPRIVPWLERSDFRERFVAKGRMRSYLEGIPSFVVVHREPALVGLAALADGDALS